MFGPKPYHVLVFIKTKQWWENLKKIHLPEERVKFSRDELIELTKETQLISLEVRKMQLRRKAPLREIIDFNRLRKAFFRKYRYAYGEEIKIVKKQK